MTDHDDPGWAQPLREFGLFLIPMWGPLVQLKRRRNEANELTRLRSVFLSLNVALFLFIVVFAFIAPFDGGDEGRIPWVVVIIGILSAVWVDRIRRWPLATTTKRAEPQPYRAQATRDRGGGLVALAPMRSSRRLTEPTNETTG
jgi:hypothetical protein